MAEGTPIRILTDGLREHPAARFWNSLEPHGALPTAIGVLKEGRTRSRPEKQKSAVYRLQGIGRGGVSIIAKRCHRAQAALERRVYEEVLAGLPMPLLTYHGFVEEPDGRFGWLFLEDAGDRAFSPHVREHRVAAARWLAALHASTADVPQTIPLPDRGPGRYLEDLRATADTVRRALDQRPSRDTGAAILEAVLSRCEAVEANWGEVEAACDSVPRTLVHGDFVKKNIRVRSDTRGFIALPFDWEHAGWGTPISDLAQSPPDSTRFAANPDVVTYCALVRDHWPGLEARAEERFAHFGTLFRLLASMSWEARRLTAAKVARDMGELAFYERGVATALRGLGLEG
jgi:hypothetical protein